MEGWQTIKLLHISECVGDIRKIGVSSIELL